MSSPITAFPIQTTPLAGHVVTSVATGTGLTGGPITSTGTVSLSSSGATPGSYGSSSSVPVVTVDATGRITAVTTEAISSGSGDVSGPGSSTNGHIPTYSGTTGKIIQDASGISASGGVITGDSTLSLVSGGSNTNVEIQPKGSGFIHVSKSSGDATVMVDRPATSNSAWFSFRTGGTGPQWLLGLSYQYSTAGNFVLDWYDGAATEYTFLQMTTTGALQLPAYGAGTLVTDSSGNVTASSDSRLKNIDGDFNRGLSDVLKLTPKFYHWREGSGMNPKDQCVGLIAQDVQTVIPEAVGSSKDGILTLSDRPLIAALINAVKELSSRIETLEKQ